MALAFNIGCPDKKGCSHLASRPLVIGFMCIGKLKDPTDHVFKGVNDLQFCFKQNGRLNRWHFNRGDIRVFRFLLGKAEKRLEATDAVHNTGAKEDSRPGD
jgi:hypothetical protein